MITVNKKLALLRKEMQKASIQACIIPSTDPHAGEYIADYWKEREWISGFDGSAGTAIITLDKACLWVDSRYFLQADEQMAVTEFLTMKEGLPETPDMITWLRMELKAGDKVGVNPRFFTTNVYTSMSNELGFMKIQLVSVDCIGKIWVDRPSLPTNPLFLYDVTFAGKSFVVKLAELRTEMRKYHADVLVVTALDEIAWLFNIRGSDVDFNPVVIAYALVDLNQVTLYIENQKLNDESKAYMTANKIVVKGYEQIYEDLTTLSGDQYVWVNGSGLNQFLFEAIPGECNLLNRMSPIAQLKSVKNEVELAGVRHAMLKDGVALTRFYRWLESNIASGVLTEISLADKLRSFRAEQKHFYGESFSPIVGYASHGAIVHYKADIKSNATILPNNLLLIDSGGQYLEGTTDITRTIALGNPSPEQKTDFTLVLKGHISLASAVFPVGTRGSQLDILARKALWNKCMNYGHGTGHGVGHFLNVHEGPQNIRMDENPTILRTGMILSNEPGVYKSGKYGIRTENLILVIPSESTEFGQFLKFETLTFFPVDTNLVDVSLMTSKEIDWLNEYHRLVYEKIAPYLNAEEKTWLQNKTMAIR